MKTILKMTAKPAKAKQYKIIYPSSINKWMPNIAQIPIYIR